MRHPRRHNSTFACLAVLCLLLTLVPVARGEETVDTLDLFNAWQGESAAAVRAPKPLSRTAETITVVTRRDIEALNAHTLGDILVTLSGIQVQRLGGPGSVTYTLIQGSDFNHVLVLLDGVPLNNSNNFSDVGLVPARIIERVEVIKGPASSVWGQALGGVISVTTREPAPDRPLAGTLDGSIGSRASADSGGELNGTTGRLGYLLSGGYLRSDGIRQKTDVSAPTAYAKFTWQMPGNGQIWGTFGYARAVRGNIFAPMYGFQEDSDATHLTGSLGLQRDLANGLDLELLLRHSSEKDVITDSDLSDLLLAAKSYRYNVTGGSARLSWQGARQLAVGGVDYEHANYHQEISLAPDLAHRRNADRWGVYANDTIDLGPVSVIPGIRFDHTEHGNQWSPSLGAVWRLTESTLLRGYVAQGFSLADITVDQGPERGWTARLGVESEAVPYLWLRGTLFRNELWDVAASPGVQMRWTTCGTELELRTAPVFNTSIAAGYTFMDSRSPDGAQVPGSPRHSLNLSLAYDDRTIRGSVTGRQVNWNAPPEDNGRYHALIFDLFLGAKVLQHDDRIVELFFSGHNLFTASMYPFDALPNTGRWFEGGVKVSF